MTGILKNRITGIAMIDFGIIAAGDGNRIKEEGSLLPKPLVGVENTPMIGRLVTLMAQCGARSVSVIVNSGMPEVVSYLEGLSPEIGCGLKIMTARTPSSMHSFYELLNLMKPEDKFVVTTVDTIFRRENFREYVRYFDNAPAHLDGLMGVTGYIDDEKPLYVETDPENHIIAYKDSPGERIRYVSAGVYGLRGSSLKVLQQCIDSGVNRMRNFQRRLVEEGLRLDAFDMGKVFDIDHLSDLEKANTFLV